MTPPISGESISRPATLAPQDELEEEREEDDRCEERHGGEPHDGRSDDEDPVAEEAGWEDRLRRVPLAPHQQPEAQPPPRRPRARARTAPGLARGVEGEHQEGEHGPADHEHGAREVDAVFTTRFGRRSATAMSASATAPTGRLM
jgi:hypothetical protein